MDSPFKRPFINLDLKELGEKLFDQNSKHLPKMEDTARCIRGLSQGKVIFDTIEAKYVWEHKWFPQFWVPRKSLKLSDQITLSEPTEIPGVSAAKLSEVIVDNATPIAVLLAEDGPLSGYVKFNFSALDEWFEEDSRILYHPRDPYHRVDILPSSRKVKIEIDGVVLADTSRGGGLMSLWETHFPGRWYLPGTAVEWKYLSDSSMHTGCPYKGEASYYDVNLPNGKKIENAVWYYKSPLPESGDIKGMLCFYPEKVDMWVDGQRA